jgi:hypothetical protein
MYSMGLEDVSKMPGKTTAAGLSYRTRETRSYQQMFTNRFLGIDSIIPIMMNG